MHGGGLQLGEGLSQDERPGVVQNAPGEDPEPDEERVLVRVDHAQQQSLAVGLGEEARTRLGPRRRRRVAAGRAGLVDVPSREPAQIGREGRVRNTQRRVFKANNLRYPLRGAQVSVVY